MTQVHVLSPRLVSTLAQDVCGVCGADAAPLHVCGDRPRVGSDAFALYALLRTRRVRADVCGLSAELATARWMRLGESYLGWCGSAGRRC